MRYFIIYRGPGRYLRRFEGDGDTVFFRPAPPDEQRPRGAYDLALDDQGRLVLIEDPSTRFRIPRPCSPIPDWRPPQRIVAQLGEEINPDVYHLLLHEI